jgi:hypothetical protein
VIHCHCCLWTVVAAVAAAAARKKVVIVLDAINAVVGAVEVRRCDGRGGGE